MPGNMPQTPMMDSARLFDWPACLQVFDNRPDNSPHGNRTYSAAHSTGISKIPRLHKDIPPLRFQKCPFSAKGKIIVAHFNHNHESNADEMHPIQTVVKTKIGTLAMHRSKKLYVHATMKNEVLLDA
jgi:hypothetical protein